MYLFSASPYQLFPLSLFPFCQPSLHLRTLHWASHSEEVSHQQELHQILLLFLQWQIAAAYLGPAWPPSSPSCLPVRLGKSHSKQSQFFNRDSPEGLTCWLNTDCQWNKREHHNSNSNSNEKMEQNMLTWTFFAPLFRSSSTDVLWGSMVTCNPGTRMIGLPMEKTKL